MSYICLWKNYGIADMDKMIRPAEEKDLEAVGKLLEQVLAIHHAGRPDLFRGEGKKYSDARLVEIFSDPRTPVFVYEEDGQVLGYAFCELEKPQSGSLEPVETLYLDDLCVDERARGRHIGKALFDYVKDYARAEGGHNITLHAWECNPGALAFYKALGLQPQYTCLEYIL